MEITSEVSSQHLVNGSDSPIIPPVCDHGLLVSEIESLRQSYKELQTKSIDVEANLILVQNQRDDANNQNINLSKFIDEISNERDSLRAKVDEVEASRAGAIEEESRYREDLIKELEMSRDTVLKSEIEKERIYGYLLRSTNSIRSIKDFMVKTIESLSGNEKNVSECSNTDILDSEINQEPRVFLGEIASTLKLAEEVESTASKYKEKWKQEKRELERSVVSLTEENRDINSLLRIALVEKEAVEKSLSKLRGNSEQKRVALLQIAERGLQRVGFGFMMGSGSNELQLETSGATTTGSTISDGSECEEEVVSLASTVEKIMKNLRAEITQLRRSLEESRSDTERLQSLTEKQAQRIGENTSYITYMEDRERALAQNVEELLTELKETEADVARWREACELEVKAGKKEIEEREKLVNIIKKELEKTKAALQISNGKLKLKEELVITAMAAQAAAEKSLQLADSRAAGLRERIEELTKQLEEVESKERSRRKVRHICWPWRALKVANNTNTRFRNVKRMLPEMQALLH